jgi:hypothetical protein
MNVFWTLHKDAFVFRNFILNSEMVSEIRDIVMGKTGKLLPIKVDRRTDFRQYYDIPTEQDYQALLSHV